VAGLRDRPHRLGHERGALFAGAGVALLASAAVAVAATRITWNQEVAAGIAMLVMWIGALVKLGLQRAWGWFIGVLVLHLVGLGIVGMGAYAVAGPQDEDLVVIRPATPV